MPGTKSRDLASAELWQHSLERSRRRRVLAAAGRKIHNRRRRASVAVSAAMAAAPVWPSVTASANDLSKNDVGKLARKLRRDHGERVLLAYGDTSPAVADLQRALGILDDGIFGPQTRAAVRAFQEREGLRETGKVDVRTWLKLFPNDVIVYAPAGSAAALGASDGPHWAAVTASGADTASSEATIAAADPSGAAEAAAPRARDAALHAAGLPGAFANDADPAGAAQPTAGAPGGQPAVGVPAPSPNGGGAAPQGGAGPAPSPPPLRPGESVGEVISALLAAANRIDARHYAYRWGGGHNSGFSGPYDCSGAVSAVLHAAGLLRAPLVSGDFVHWGAPGPGTVTIYANAGHVYMSILGRYFGTSRSNPGGGAGWFRGGPRPGFAVVHVPFSRLHIPPPTRARFRASSPATTSSEELVSGGTPAPTTSQRASAPASPPSYSQPASTTPATVRKAPAPAAAPVAGQPVGVSPQAAPAPTAPAAVTAPTAVTGPTAPAAPTPPTAVTAPTAVSAPAATSPASGETQAVGTGSGTGVPGGAPPTPQPAPASAPAGSAAQGAGTPPQAPAGSSGADQQPTGSGSQGPAPAGGSEGSGEAAGSSSSTSSAGQQSSPQPDAAPASTGSGSSSGSVN